MQTQVAGDFSMEARLHGTHCQACNAACKPDDKTCAGCGFFDKLGMAHIWLCGCDAETWMDEVVVPYRKHIE